MQRLLRRAGKLACVLLCLATAAISFWQWTGEHGEEALLFAAGLKIDGESGSAAGTASAAPREKASHRVLTADDGIAVFHEDELPRAEVTPEPGRSWGEVQEIELSGGTQIADFFVKDTTGSGTDLNYELTQESPAKLKGDGSVEVLIYHTHTSEAYCKSYTGFYYTDMPTRTADEDMSVVAAGETLKKTLESYGIGVVHDTTVCDELFNGSYSRSWEVLQSNLEKYPGIQVTIDLHRDSMTADSGLKYKPTVEISGRKSAQIMLLAGCNADGTWDDFPDWKENLRMMLRLQQTAQSLYPGLARPLNFSNNRYNMNAAPGSLLVEVGTEVNTVSEAKYAARLFGEVLAKTLLKTE